MERVIEPARECVTANPFGDSPDANRPGPVPNPVKLSDIDPPLQARAKQQMLNAGYYTEIVNRLNNALEFEGIHALYAMQPELILSHKRQTDAEKRFADYMRKISGRYVTYMYENLRPEIARSMDGVAKEKGFPFVDLENAFDQTAEKTFTDYCHLTPLGNQLVAERIYAAMAATTVPELIRKSQ